MLKRLLYLFIISLLAGTAFGFDLNKLTLTKGLKRYTLPNGLKVVIKEEPSVPLVGLAVNYNVGFRNDTKGNSGLSHLLEHMMFKNTQKYKVGEISKIMSELGAQNNAYTTYTHTAYWEVLPTAGLEKAMEIEAERMVNCLFTEDEFKKEANVVLSELSARAGNPSTRLSDKLYPETFGDHPFTYRSGVLSDISNANRDFVYKELYKKYYAPNNATVFIVGDVKAEDAMKWVKKYFGGLKASPGLKPLPPNPMKWNMKADVTVEGVASEDFGTIMYKLPPEDINNEDYIALSFIHWAGIIGGFYYWATPDGGIGYTDYSKEPDYPAETINPQVIRDNFDYYKSKLFNQERLDYDSISSILMTMVWLDGSSSLDNYEKLTRGFKDLSADKVIAVINKYLNKDNSVKGFFKATKKDKNARPQSGQNGGGETHGSDIDFTELEKFNPQDLKAAQDRLDDIKKGTLDSLDKYLSSVKIKTLANGLTVIYRPFTLNEKVSISVGIKAGSIYQELPRQAEQTYSFVFRGGPQTALYNELVKTGLRVNSKVDYTTSGMSIDLPKEKYSQSIEMLGLALKDRKFIPLILEEEKLRQLTALEQFKRNTEAVKHAQKEINKLVLGKQGGGLDFHINEKQIVALNIQDLQDFYLNNYRPENTVITVVGNIDYDSVIKEIEKVLGSWNPAPKTHEYRQAVLQSPGKIVKKKVKVPSSYQSVVLMAAPTVDYTDTTNYAAFMLANEIFGGGGLTSKLMRVIRDSHGLTYGVYSYPYPYGDQNMFRLYMQNAPGDVDQAVSYFYEELEKYKKTGPTDMEIVKFKTSRIIEMLFAYENASRIADILLYYQIRRGQLDYDKTFIGILYGLDRKILMNAIDKYMPRDLFIIEAGN